MTLKNVRPLLSGFADPVPDLAVTGVTADSRDVTPGGLFLAAAGARTHGLAHAREAVEAGAVAIAYAPTPGVDLPPLAVPLIAVPNLGAHLGSIAARFYERPSAAMFVAGVTGTDGKTSTAWLAAQALQRLGTNSSYVGTIGYGLIDALREASHTTPDAVRLQALLAEQRRDGAKAVVMEVSSHALHQHRIDGVELDVAVLTNVARDHLDYHGSVEAYAEAKRMLFAHPGLRHTVLNRDDAHGKSWAENWKSPARLTVYGIGGERPPTGDYLLAENVETHGDGLRFEVRAPEGRALIDSRLLARFNVYNLLAALAILRAQGANLIAAAAALSAAPTVPGRAEGFRGPQAAALVVVDYAHTPQALEQILAAIRPHTRGRLLCVFGCGGDRDRGKRPLMGLAAATTADAIFVTDDNPRFESPAAIVADIVEGVPAALRGKLQVIHDRAAAMEAAITAAGVDDVIVVAGKGHEDYQLYGPERRSFSDRVWIATRVGAVVPS